MPDVFTKKKRSWVMSRIRGKNTKIENSLEREMKKSKIKFKSYPKIYGSPDFLVNKNIVIFVDGCFWHMCPLHYVEPKSKKNFWIPKIERNVERDKEVTKKLKKMNYTVIRIWEHDVKKRPEYVIKKLKALSETV